MSFFSFSRSKDSSRIATAPSRIAMAPVPATNRDCDTIGSVFAEFPVMRGPGECCGQRLSSPVGRGRRAGLFIVCDSHNRVVDLTLGGGYRGRFPDLSSLTELRKLSLSENRLRGPIPESLGSLKHLKTVFLDSNKLTGPVPDIFENLPELEYFVAHENKFTGPIPESIWRLPNIQYIDFSYNSDLTGEPPSNLTSGVKVKVDKCSMWRDDPTSEWELIC